MIPLKKKKINKRRYFCEKNIYEKYVLIFGVNEHIIEKQRM